MNFSNQPHQHTGDSLMTQTVNEWRVTPREWVTIKAIFVCGSAFVWLCLPVYNCVWSLPAAVRLWIRSNETTHSDNGSHAVHTVCTGLKGTGRLWLWSSPQQPFLCSNAAFLLLIYPFGLKLLLPRLQIELRVVLNMEYPPVVTGYGSLASRSEAFWIVSDLKGEDCG